MRNLRTFFRLIILIPVLASFVACNSNKVTYYLTAKSKSDIPLQYIVSFTLPHELEEQRYYLEDADGNKFPVQRDSNGKAWTVLDLEGGDKEKDFKLLSLSEDSVVSGIKYIENENSVSFSINDKPIFTYQKEGALANQAIDSAYLRGGYIHPVYTPSERIITDDYPTNHVHHHGIWGAWTKTEFEGRTPDFWNMGDKTGKVDFVSLDSLFDGPVMAGFSAKHEYTDLSGSAPKTTLTETWDVKIFNLENGSRPLYLFDIEISQECASSSPLILPEYRYGGIGFRGREEWNGEENTIFRTSEGKDRSNGHGTTARWCHIGGLVEGKPAGVTIMSHPDNFRAPQPMRIHPSEPFFNFAPSQAGDWAITPDKPYLAKYRFVVYDGEPDTELLESLWQAYANPLEVEVNFACKEK